VKFPSKAKERQRLSQTNKLRTFVASRPVLQRMLKEVLQRKKKFYSSETWICIEKGRASVHKISKSKIKLLCF
jgi:hypothetical protein